jgi:serine/threonine protein kinase
VKLGDFGVWSEISSDSTKRAHIVIGAPHYMAPEQCVPSKDKGENRIQFPVDEWALGVTVYETCALKRPFEGSTPYSTYKLIQSAVCHPLPDHYSHGFKTLISKMLYEYPPKQLQLQFTILFVISI